MIRAESLSLFKEGLLKELAGIFPEMQILDGFRKEQVYKAVEQPFLAMNIQKIFARSDSCSDYWGTAVQEDGSTEVYGRLAEVTFRFQFGLPAFSCLSETTLFLRLCNYLLGQPDYDFSEILCGEVEFSQAMQCFVLTASAKTKIILKRQEIFQPIRDIVVQTKK